MSFALVTDDTIQRIGPAPKSARRLDNGAWVLGLRDASAELQQACGWYEITDTAQPADTDTTTHDRSVDLVAGVPTVVWTERDKTADELNPPPTTEEQVAELQALLDALLGEDE